MAKVADGSGEARWAGPPYKFGHVERHMVYEQRAKWTRETGTASPS